MHSRNLSFAELTVHTSVHVDGVSSQTDSAEQPLPALYPRIRPSQPLKESCVCILHYTWRHISIK